MNFTVISFWVLCKINPVLGVKIKLGSKLLIILNLKLLSELLINVNVIDFSVLIHTSPNVNSFSFTKPSILTGSKNPSPWIKSLGISYGLNKVLYCKTAFSTFSAFGVNFISNAWYFLGGIVALVLLSKEKQSLWRGSNWTVAATTPSFLSTIWLTALLFNLNFLNLSKGVPSASYSLGDSSSKVGKVPSPLSSNFRLPVLSVPPSTVASNNPEYGITFVGLNVTVTYSLSPG